MFDPNFMPGIDIRDVYRERIVEVLLKINDSLERIAKNLEKDKTIQPNKVRADELGEALRKYLEEV